MSEKDFQAELARLAPLFRSKIVVIPDVIPIDKYGKVIKSGQIHISRKRPFDVILVTWRQNYCLECKFGDNKQKPHQKETERKINCINRSYYIVRKKVYAKTRRVEYIVEQNGDKLFKTEDISKLFDFFLLPEEYVSQKSIDVLIPEKKRMRRVIY